jgi:hypothetical protein
MDDYLPGDGGRWRDCFERSSQVDEYRRRQAQYGGQLALMGNVDAGFTLTQHSGMLTKRSGTSLSTSPGAVPARIDQLIQLYPAGEPKGTAGGDLEHGRIRSL